LLFPNALGRRSYREAPELSFGGMADLPEDVLSSERFKERFGPGGRESSRFGPGGREEGRDLGPALSFGGMADIPEDVLLSERRLAERAAAEQKIREYITAEGDAAKEKLRNYFRTRPQSDVLKENVQNYLKNRAAPPAAVQSAPPAPAQSAPPAPAQSAPPVAPRRSLRERLEENRRQRGPSLEELANEVEMQRRMAAASPTTSTPEALAEMLDAQARERAPRRTMTPEYAEMLENMGITPDPRRVKVSHLLRRKTSVKLAALKEVLARYKLSDLKQADIDKLIRGNVMAVGGSDRQTPAEEASIEDRLSRVFDAADSAGPSDGTESSQGALPSSGMATV